MFVSACVQVGVGVVCVGTGMGWVEFIFMTFV